MSTVKLARLMNMMATLSCTNYLRKYGQRELTASTQRGTKWLTHCMFIVTLYQLLATILAVSNRKQHATTLSYA